MQELPPRKTREGYLVWLTEAVDGCVRHGRNQREQNRASPAESTPMARDCGHPDYGSACRDLLGIGIAQVAAAEDQIRAAATVAMADNTAYALETLARGSAEASARGWWLLDPDLDTATRAARGLSERRESMVEWLKMARLLAQEGAEDSEVLREIERTEQRLQHLDSKARELGFEETKWARRGRERTVAYDGQVFNATDTLKKMLAGKGLRIGDVLYALLSGTLHARWSSLSQKVVGSEETALDGDMIIAVTEIRLDDVLGTLQIMATAWVQAMGRVMVVCGWPRVEWETWVDHLRSRGLVPLRADQAEDS